MIFLINGVVFFLQKPCNSSHAPQVSGLSKVLCFFLFLGAVAQSQESFKNFNYVRKQNQDLQQGQSISKNHFFILSKGLNAGKPLTEPCPNCFVFHAETEQEKDFYIGLYSACGKLINLKFTWLARLFHLFGFLI